MTFKSGIMSKLLLLKECLCHFEVNINISASFYLSIYLSMSSEPNQINSNQIYLSMGYQPNQTKPNQIYLSMGHRRKETKWNQTKSIYLSIYLSICKPNQTKSNQTKSIDLSTYKQQIKANHIYLYIYLFMGCLIPELVSYSSIICSHHPSQVKDQDTGIWFLW